MFSVRDLDLPSALTVGVASITKWCNISRYLRRRKLNAVTKAKHMCEIKNVKLRKSQNFDKL